MQAFAVSQRYLQTRSALDSVESLAACALARHRAPLDDTDHKAGRTAWTYFNRFSHTDSGFAPATSQGRSLGPWEMGATLLAIVSAGRLGLLSARVVEDRLGRCLASLARLSLGPHRLPALRYEGASLRMLDSKGRPSHAASGWSARAVMRLVAGFIVTAHHFPAFAPEISLILNRWDLTSLLSRGQFRSAVYRTGAPPEYVQDLFLGYEQYAARTACLINLPAEPSLDPRRHLSAHKHGAILLPGDRRLQRFPTAAITMEPFFLEALEFGWRDDMLDIASSCFLAQKARFEQTGHLTALTEDCLDQAPGFAFHTMLAGDRPFASVSRAGRDLSHLRCLSTKAAHCWSVLMPTPYSQKLLDAVDETDSPDGWQAGLYERGGRPNTALSLNTNAVILEALHYKAFGPLFPAGG